jgi:hypothetical protein
MLTDRYLDESGGILWEIRYRRQLTLWNLAAASELSR